MDKKNFKYEAATSDVKLSIFVPLFSCVEEFHFKILI